MDKHRLKERGEHMGIARRIARNSVFLIISKVQGILIALIIFALTARYLGSELFGLLAFIVAISMVIRPIANFGFENIICREISKSKKDMDLYVGTTVDVRIVFSILIIAISYLMIHMSSTWEAEANHALMVAIVTELLMSMGATYLAVIRAFERMEWELFTNIIHKLLSLALLLVVIFYDLGFLMLFYARLLPAVIFLLASAAFLYGKFVKASFSFSSSFAWFIIKEAYPIAIFTFLLTLILRVDIYFLKWFKGLTDVAIFEVPNRVIVQVQIFAVSVSLSLFPLLSRSADTTSQGLLERYYRNTYKVLFFSGVMIAGLLFVGGAPLIIVLVGRGYLDASVPLRILAPTTIFLFLMPLQSNLLTAIGRQMLNAFSIGIALVVNIVLDLLLIPSYSYVGASVATLISYFTMVALNSYFIAKYDIRIAYDSVFFKKILSGSIMLLTLFINIDNPILTLLARLSAATLLYIVSLLILKAVSKDEIEALKGFFSKKHKRGKVEQAAV